MNNSENTDSDDDWFNKDDAELLKGLENKVDKAKNDLKEADEIIEHSIESDEFLRQCRLDAAKVATGNLPRIQTADLRKLESSQNALDAFLFAFTQDSCDFFVNQIQLNDTMERVLLYIRVYSMIASLKVPGFHTKIIEYFTQDENLFKQTEIIVTKIFTKKHTKLWNSDADQQRLERFISDMQLLLLQACTLNLLTQNAIKSVACIKRLFKKADSIEINRKVCLEFSKNLDMILAAENSNATSNEEIYPTLAELIEDSPKSGSTHLPSDLSLASYNYSSVTEYLSIQKTALRDDFILSLADCVQVLKRTRNLSSSLSAHVTLYENVEIILNENFLNAYRHEMLFAKICVTKSCTIQELKSLKTGTLICFTTSYDFDNLILALVTYQDAGYSENGLVAIEIVRQFNIGNIYNKKLIMFTSPAFFEPYSNVYNYLRSCSIDDFPLKDLIVFGKPDPSPPSYLSTETIFESDRCKFKPLQDALPPQLPLNISQRESLKIALTQKFALIQGPPGTGKTHLSVQLVKMLLENKTPMPIIIVAYTNESLDKFLLKILTYTKSIARLGGQSQCPEIQKYNIQHNTPMDAEWNVKPRLNRLYYLINTKFKNAFTELQILQKEFDGTDESYAQILLAQRKVLILSEQLNTIRLLFRYYIVRKRSIVALTTTCAAKMNFLFRLLGSQIVIFEEAAEILESHVLSCLTPTTEHVVMIGDHKQLKPYTSNYQHSRSCDLNISLFERLINRGILSPTVLLTQYRMRPIIAKLICPIFYDVLHNDESVEKYPPVRGMHENLYFLNQNKHFEQVKSDGIYQKSFYNNDEANEIVKLAVHLIEKACYEHKDLVILSPYASQCAAIGMKLPSNLKSLRVMTVDSFQGLEANIVLLSLVRYNQEGQIGFLKEKNRVCVALSRARHGLYITGNLDFLANSSSTWLEIKNELISHGLVGTTFPISEIV